jgi:hypothetical protein
MVDQLRIDSKQTNIFNIINMLYVFCAAQQNWHKACEEVNIAYLLGSSHF